MKYALIAFMFWAMPVLAQGFLPGTEDIPLMEGLTQVEETASFDNPTERMVLISAQTKLAKQNILEFYRKSLNNLGWQEKAPGQFKRGADSLFIDIIKMGKTNQIQFRLSQQNL